MRKIVADVGPYASNFVSNGKHEEGQMSLRGHGFVLVRVDAGLRAESDVVILIRV
jgi:hypothetical protein